MAREHVKCIGEDMHLFEKVEITYLATHFVNVSLLYEKLEKHCHKCLKLDHDLKDCLEPKV
ncbi:hypothetical protein HID58_043289 [Brassica napus]|uniref:Zinc knuckle CX2CX4HX4C domain-containing protein n=1 Tax=Brassica napus TaxID=3708 RepID=A0ABQ8BHT4_BRANA|nr:hypothetical protein HID58_043289 [Brassica napus]